MHFWENPSKTQSEVDDQDWQHEAEEDDSPQGTHIQGLRARAKYFAVEGLRNKARFLLGGDVKYLPPQWVVDVPKDFIKDQNNLPDDEWSGVTFPTRALVTAFKHTETHQELAQKILFILKESLGLSRALFLWEKELNHMVPMAILGLPHHVARGFLFDRGVPESELKTFGDRVRIGPGISWLEYPYLSSCFSLPSDEITTMVVIPLAYRKHVKGYILCIKQEIDKEVSPQVLKNSLELMAPIAGICLQELEKAKSGN